MSSYSRLTISGVKIERDRVSLLSTKLTLISNISQKFPIFHIDSILALLLDNIPDIFVKKKFCQIEIRKMHFMWILVILIKNRIFQKLKKKIFQKIL